MPCSDHFLLYFLCPTGSVIVDFEVEAEGSDDASFEALKANTTSLKNNLASAGVSLNIGAQSFEAPVQNITIAEVDVTPAVKETYRYKFKVFNLFVNWVEIDNAADSQLLTDAGPLRHLS